MATTENPNPTPSQPTQAVLPAAAILRGKRVVLAGGSGFVGTALTKRLLELGCEVEMLVRRPATAEPEDAHRGGALREHRWNPAGPLDPSVLSGAVGLVHLGGVSVASGRWTAERRRAILESRVKSTQTLVDALGALPGPRPAFVCASAVGYYGYRGQEILTEDASPGSTFLAEVCQAWEAQARRASSNTRAVQLRIGMVVGQGGGALASLLPPFRAGVGGRLGDGHQYMSWIALTDLTRAIVHCLVTDSLQAAVNGTSPEPVTNREFTKELGRVLGRPTLLPVPAFALQAVLGEFAQELLHGQRAIPSKLSASGFEFQFPTLGGALENAIND